MARGMRWLTRCGPALQHDDATSRDESGTRWDESAAPKSWNRQAANSVRPAAEHRPPKGGPGRDELEWLEQHG